MCWNREYFPAPGIECVSRIQIQPGLAYQRAHTYDLLCKQSREKLATANTMRYTQINIQINENQILALG